MKAKSDSRVKGKHLLIAVDQSESSKRAVLYVADFLGGFPGFRVTLLSVIPEPEEDFFEDMQGQADWIKKRGAETVQMLENYRQVLIQSGFAEDKVVTRSPMGEGKSMAEAILETQCGLTCCTIVVGRHHHSRTEEFLFGSTSSKLVREARNCAIWVVE